MSNEHDFLSKLNKNQLKAATAMGRVCVIAGAGTGKTTTLISAILDKLENKDIHSDRIFISTFTKKATNEMAERLADYGYSSPKFLGTFHSNARKLISRFPALGGGINVHKLEIFAPEDAEAFAKEHIIMKLDEAVMNHITAIAEERQEEISRDELNENGRKKKRILTTARSLAKDFVNYVSDLKSCGVFKISEKSSSERSAFYLGKKALDNPVGAYLCDLYFDDYINKMHLHNAMDFDDLINVPVRVMEGDEKLQDHVSSIFDAVFVDEDQDTNAIQNKFANMISRKAKVFFRVGDDGQSIYGWRGSQVELLREFKKTADITVTLDENYRSTQNILDYSSSILENDDESDKKNLIASGRQKGNDIQISHINLPGNTKPWDEAHIISHEIKNRLRDDLEPKDIAVLVRANYLGNFVYTDLVKDSIPVVFTGDDLFKNKNVRFMLAYAMIAIDPENTINTIRLDDLFDNKHMPVRGIGEKTIERIIESVTEHDNFKDGLLAFKEKIKNDAYNEFVDKLFTYADMVGNRFKDVEPDAFEIFNSIYHDSGLQENLDNRKAEIVDILEYERPSFKNRRERDLLSSEHDSIENAQEYIRDFIRIVQGSTVREAIEQIQLARDVQKSSDRNAVTIMTIHTAKGLEWDVVYCFGFSESNITGQQTKKKNPKEFYESIRCLYVAFTRPRKELFVSGAPLMKIMKSLETKNLARKVS